MDKEIEKKLDRKQGKIKIFNKEPLKSDGSNGDLRICSTSRGVELFVKYNGSWYYTTLTKSGV